MSSLLLIQLTVFCFSLSQNQNWKLHISYPTQSPSLRLRVLYSLRQVFPLPSCCPYTGSLFVLIWSTHRTCVGVSHTQPLWTEWRQRFFILSTLLLSLPVFYLSNFKGVLHLSLSSIDIFLLTGLMKFLTACVSSPATLLFYLLPYYQNLLRTS